MYQCKLCGRQSNAPLCPGCFLIIILFSQRDNEFDRFRKRVSIESIIDKEMKNG